MSFSLSCSLLPSPPHTYTLTQCICFSYSLHFSPSLFRLSSLFIIPLLSLPRFLSLSLFLPLFTPLSLSPSLYLPLFIPPPLSLSPSVPLFSLLSPPFSHTHTLSLCCFSYPLYHIYIFFPQVDQHSVSYTSYLHTWEASDVHEVVAPVCRQHFLTHDGQNDVKRQKEEREEKS